MEIAREHGARVLEIPWPDDFAKARNHALDHVTGRWVLYVDADERLQPTTRAEVERLLAPDDLLALSLGLRPTPGSTPYLELRVWRNDPAIRFAGVIHEKVHPAILAVAERSGRRIADAPGLELVHVGYEDDQERKHRRNLPLLERQLEREPDNVFNWRHLAEVREGLGDRPGAREALERAVALARAADEPDLHGAVAYSHLAEVLREDGEPVAELLREGRARYPEDWMLVWLDARRKLDEGDPGAALPDLDALLSVEVPELHGAISYDEAIFGALAHEARGLALLRLGRPAEAAGAFARAEVLAPDAPALKVKRRLAEARAGLPGDRRSQ